MNKKIKGLLITVGALLLLLGFYCLLILPLNGSILHKRKLTERVSDYVAQNYGQDFTVADTVYDSKLNSYICYVQSAQSPDSRFSIWEGRDGTLTDHYDFEVGQKENTIARLMREMETQMTRSFLPGYPMGCADYSCAFQKELLDTGTPAVRENFQLDMPLDMQAPPLPLELTLRVESNDPSWQVLAQAIKQAKATADKLGWQVSYYSVSLCIPTTEAEGDVRGADTDFSVVALPWDQIEVDTLALDLQNARQAE